MKTLFIILLFISSMYSNTFDVNYLKLKNDLNGINYCMSLKTHKERIECLGELLIPEGMSFLNNQTYWFEAKGSSASS